MTGRLVQIWVKRSHGGVMDARTEATLRAGRGIEGNADQGGPRQVTLLSRERWIALMGELGAAIEPAERRANFLVSGVDLTNSRGRVLCVGGCRLRVAGETRPCRRMEETGRGLQAAMQRDWGGGVFAEVLEDGTVSVGDPVSWETDQSAV